MSTPTPTNWQYLERRPKSSYRQLFLKDRRIRARSLYGMFVNESDPQSPEQIAAEFDLAVDAVREAIAYCETNPREIEEDYLCEKALMEAAGMNDPNYKYNGKPKVVRPEERARLLPS